MHRALLMVALLAPCTRALAHDCGPARPILAADTDRGPHPDNSVDVLYQCFYDAACDVGQAGHFVAFGPSSNIYFFEQLGAAMQALGNTPSIDWCDPWFVQPYLRAHTALHGPDATQPTHDPKLPLSTGVHLAQESRLIHLASRMGGVSHVSAHADLMRLALATPKVARELGRLRINTCSRGLLVQGAQVPDLYLFDQPLWHAQTEPSGIGPHMAQTVPKQDVTSSESQFVALVVATVHAARHAALTGDIEQAMVRLGAAAHAVQDLSYHRGMTMAEKAGLTFVAHNNPDLPHEPYDQRLAHDAIAATSALLVAAFAPLPKGLAQDQHVVAEDAEALLQLVTDVWPEAKPVDYLTMRRYFDLSSRYQSPVLSAAALGLAQASAGRWQPTVALASILAAL